MNLRLEEFKEEVRRRNDIVEVISQDVPLQRRGQNFVGLCPFHQERTPSFNVSPERQMYYCFGCHSGGDVFRYIMEVRRLDFRGALEYLAHRVGLTVPQADLSPQARRLLRQKARLYEVLEAAAQWFEDALRRPEAKAARRYLVGRGMTPETARRFRIGWAPGEWSALAGALGPRFGMEALAAAGLVLPRRQGEGYYDRFRGRIIFPICDQQDRVIAFGGRLLGQAADQAKYVNSPETILFKKRSTLYGLGLALPAIQRTGRVLVVEGYTDAIACHQGGIDYAVASMGTALSPEQAALLARYGRQIFIAYDADGAGQAATLRGLNQLAALGDVDVRVVALPGGADPDSFIRQHGIEAFQAMLEEAMPLLDWRFDLARQRHDEGTVGGKVRIVAEVAPLLAQMPRGAAQSGYVETFAQQLGLPASALWDEIRKLGAGAQAGRAGHKTRNGRDNNSAVNGRTAQWGLIERLEQSGGAEQTLLRLLLHYPEMGVRVWDEMAPDEFSLPEYRDIARTLAAVGAGSHPDEMEERKSVGHTVLDSVTLPAARRLVARLAMQEPQLPGDPEEVLGDLILGAKRDALHNQHNWVAAEIRRLEAQDQEVPIQLIRLAMELERRFRELQAQGTARLSYRPGKSHNRPDQTSTDG